jgi:hypothetical protein
LLLRTVAVTIITLITSAVYGNISKWDAPLPWELRKNMTVVAFAESAAAGSSSLALGPITLRKTYLPAASSSSSLSSSTQSVVVAAAAVAAVAGGSSMPAGLTTAPAGSAVIDFEDNLDESSSSSSSSSHSSAFAPSRPDAAPSTVSKLMMTAEDLQQAESLSRAARQREEAAAAAATPAGQARQLAGKVGRMGADVNSKLQAAADQAQAGLQAAGVHKGIGAIKGSASQVVEGVKTGLQKGASSISSSSSTTTTASSSSTTEKASNLMGKMSTMFKRS